MYPPSGNSQAPSASKHTSALSQDTTASGIADSTISNGESLRLSEFPQPPASLPTTPIRSGFGPPSPIRRTFVKPAAPLIPQRGKLSPVPANTRPSSITHPLGSTAPPRAGSGGHTVSPYDWHDGASSISNGIDDRLLSTSFITSLLRERSDGQGSRRTSCGSDALSGFSEITYPPIVPPIHREPPPDQPPPVPPPSKAPPQQPHSEKLPPSSYTVIADVNNRVSGDSDTLHSSRDHGTLLARAVSLSRRLDLPGGTVVGVAPAVIHNIPPNQLISYPDSKISPTPLDTETAFLMGRTSRATTATPQIRTSVHSAKSVVPSFISRLSLSLPFRHPIARTSAKPLPPIPLVPYKSDATEIEHQRAEEFKSLPGLVHQADPLEGLLEKGYHPHQSLGMYVATHKEQGLLSGNDDTEIRAMVVTESPSNIGARDYSQYAGRSWPRSPNSSTNVRSSPQKKRRFFILFGGFLAVVLVVIGTAIGIAVGRKKKAVVCPTGFSGAACNLSRSQSCPFSYVLVANSFFSDSTCVCTSPSPGQCDALAQNIVDLIPSVNQYFSANFTTNSVYDKLRPLQGSIPGNCAAQSILVDVPSIIEALPNITHWAQAALLWNSVESQDINATRTLQNFIQDAPWDYSHITSDASSFSTTVSGYTFNFAAQEVTQPNVSFVAVGQPTAAQLSRVGPVAYSALDRMYSYAQGSSFLRRVFSSSHDTTATSTQHQHALQLYWTGVLRQKLADLPTFITALSVSPALLPFDATLSQQPQSISGLLASSPSNFPPPLGCYPGLGSSQVDQVNAIESKVFGLPPLPKASQFDASCYPNRPIYGVLDVLRLRLPFTDPRSGVPRQAAVLNRDVAPRVVLHSGAILSPLPGPSNVSDISMQLTDPRQYGTLGQWNHIILQYLSSIPDINVAIALVTYVLSSASLAVGPPTNSSVLFQSLSMIPIIEVAVFGSVISSDVTSAVSSFTTSSGALFFGSAQGTALRNWAIMDGGVSIAWAESALSPLIVRDSTFSDVIFEDTWNAVATALQNNIQNVGLINVTNSFNVNQKFTPS